MKFLTVFLAVTLAAAAVPTWDLHAAQEFNSSSVANKSVLLLSPILAFEKLQDESPLDPARFDSAVLGQRLSSAGEEYLRSKGFIVVDSLNAPTEATTSIAKLQPIAGKLARGSLTAESRKILAEAANGLGSSLILAQYLRVRVGAKGYYGPSMGGQISPGQSETLLASALIDPARGEVAWKNEVLVRKILKPESKDMDVALSALYREH